MAPLTKKRETKKKNHSPRCAASSKVPRDGCVCVLPRLTRGLFPYPCTHPMRRDLLLLYVFCGFSACMQPARIHRNQLSTCKDTPTPYSTHARHDGTLRRAVRPRREETRRAKTDTHTPDTTLTAYWSTHTCEQHRPLRFRSAHF